jgi:sugar lactone lactonase YvrE
MPYTWTITSGDLNHGLSIDQTTGVISGMPTNPGVSSFTVSVSDANGETASQPFTISITPAVAGIPSGSILASVGNGQVQMWNSTGTKLLNTFDTGTGLNTTGLAFDSTGDLYVTDFDANSVTRFNGDGTFFGSFGSGYDSDPESIVFDSNGNAYVGQADGLKQVLEFSMNGTLIGSFSPATEDRGTDWLELSPDGCTLYYTSEGTSVEAYDLCTNTQLTDFATGLPGAAAFAVKMLPNGGALVADTDSIVRLDSTGTVVQTYGEDVNASWFSLALDPSGTSFWAGDTLSGLVEKFDLSSGAVLASFNTGSTFGEDAVGGLAVAP